MVLRFERCSKSRKASPGQTMRALALGVSLLAGAAGHAPAAQQSKPQQPSVAEAARLAREQKKDAPKAKTVWTNDNLPESPRAAVSVIGTSRPAETAAGTAATDTPQPAGEASQREQERSKTEAELQAARAELAQAQRRLDLTRRELQLHRQQFFSNPQYETDDAGRARLQQLEAQEQEQAAAVAQREQRVAELEDRLRTLEAELGPKPEKPATPDQQREAWQKRLEPLRAELARVEGEIRRLREEAAARGFDVIGPGAGGSMTAQLLANLEQRRSELRRQIAEIEDEARRAGVPPAWVR